MAQLFPSRTSAVSGRRASEDVFEVCVTRESSSYLRWTNGWAVGAAVLLLLCAAGLLVLGLVHYPTHDVMTFAGPLVLAGLGGATLWAVGPLRAAASGREPFSVITARGASGQFPRGSSVPWGPNCELRVIGGHVTLQCPETDRSRLGRFRDWFAGPKVRVILRHGHCATPTEDVIAAAHARSPYPLREIG